MGAKIMVPPIITLGDQIDFARAITHSVTVEEAGIQLFIPLEIDRDHWAQFPLASHRLAPISRARLKQLKTALQIISESEPRYTVYIRDFVKTLFWMELDEKFQKQDSQITSSSFPRYPYSIFVSDKALFHIPPNSLWNRHRPELLAENLVHESIHQMVNLAIIEGELLSDTFHTATSPKIEIAWRKEQAVRNQYWEIDRTLHAICVYKEVVRFRRSLKDRASGEFKDFLTDAVSAGEFALKYLCNRIVEHRDQFSDKGEMFLTQILEDAIRCLVHS